MWFEVLSYGRSSLLTYQLTAAAARGQKRVGGGDEGLQAQDATCVYPFLRSCAEYPASFSDAALTRVTGA